MSAPEPARPPYRAERRRPARRGRRGWGGDRRLLHRFRELGHARTPTPTAPVELGAKADAVPVGGAKLYREQHTRRELPGRGSVQGVQRAVHTRGLRPGQAR